MTKLIAYMECEEYFYLVSVIQPQLTFPTMCSPASEEWRVHHKWCDLNPPAVKEQFPIRHRDHRDNKSPKLYPQNHPHVQRTTALLPAHHPKNASRDCLT